MAEDQKTFNPDDPTGALDMIDALLGQDGLNFNRATHNAISRALITLQACIEQASRVKGLEDTISELRSVGVNNSNGPVDGDSVDTGPLTLS